MNNQRKPPQILGAACATGVALLDLAVCLTTTDNSTSSAMFLIFCELILIALAVIQWVVYFRAYVDFRIEQLREEQQRATS